MKVVTVSIEELKEIIKESVENALSDKEKPKVAEELIKRKDVSKLLKISLVTLNEWMRHGKIPYYRISSRIFFKKSEVLDSLKSGQKPIKL